MNWLLTFLKSWLIRGVIVLVAGFNLHIVDAVYPKYGFNGLTDLDLGLLAEVAIGVTQIADEILESTRHL
jgi:hypothetical protein